MTAFSSSSVLSGRQPVPWRPGDAIWSAALNALGLTVIALSWLGCSGSARLSQQYGWTGAAVIGLLFAGFGNGLWLLAGRRAVGLRRRVLLTDRVAEDHRLQLGRPSGAPSARSDVRGFHDDALVIADSMTRYHRAGCMLARGKALRLYNPEKRPRKGRAAEAQPCGVCRP